MRQKLGQHFLVNLEIPDAMAAALKPSAGDTIVEIGPGHGELTQAIVRAIEAGGIKDIKLIAVERDPGLAKEVREKFASYPFLEVVEADILKFMKNRSGNKLVGNLPYYLTGHLLRVIGESKRRPELVLVMVQKEVAARMAAKPPRMNRLAAAVQFWAEPQILFEVHKNDFDPPPEVDSAVVLLTAKKNINERSSGIFYEMVRAVFAQPRKTVFNNLRSVFGKKKMSADASLKLLAVVGIDPGARPQDLSTEMIADLADKLANI